MVRANRRIHLALSTIRTSEIEVSYHCSSCKGYYTGNIETKGVSGTTCHCGSGDLLLLSVAAEPASPLLRRSDRRDWER